MLDTNVTVIETPAATDAPAPRYLRVNFRDFHCTHCGRLLMRSSLDTIAAALPQGFKDIHPLLRVALAAVVCEIRCPKCNVTNSYKPMEG